MLFVCVHQRSPSVLHGIAAKLREELLNSASCQSRHLQRNLPPELARKEQSALPK